MPSFLLSNIIFPVALMPMPLQYLGMAFPLNWYAKFYQAIAMRGASLSYLWQEIGGLLILIMAIALLLALTIVREMKSGTADSMIE
jgi:ABC-2 type transport system permease protein